MIYIYDKVLAHQETRIKRYGAYYTLENRTRMGDQMFYTFAAPGRENLLVVPRFAQQYREVEKICARFASSKKLETCCAHIRRTINRYITVEEFPTEESEDGIMWVITADYKDIRVEFHFMDKHVSVGPEFEIINNNIFGNGIVVLMNINMEE